MNGQMITEIAKVWNVPIHSDRVVNALACNSRGDGFALHLRQYFRDIFLESVHSPAWRTWNDMRGIAKFNRDL